jgi:hypothetical protein
MGVKVISQGLPILLFSATTTIYYIIKYYSSESVYTIYFCIYILFVILSQLFINVTISRSICGSNQWETAFYSTVGPWGIIFGFLYIALKTFPSWLMPFSNTFGYLLASLAGLSDVIDKLFKRTEDVKDVDLGLLERIYTDKSFIINEISINNFNNFWDNMKGLFKDEVKGSDMTVRLSLFNLVKMKELFSEYIWFMFSGFLIISVSYNFITTTTCKKSIQDMQNAHKKHVDQSIMDMVKEAGTETTLYTS